jgi:hypothetical protein
LVAGPRLRSHGAIGVLPKCGEPAIGDSRVIYEKRVYRCLPGRLPALLKRYETVVPAIWAKHGIRQAGFFTTLVGDSNQDVTYFLAWESLEREAKWTAFVTDPDWIAARNKSEEDGLIVANMASQILVPTGFSAMN